MTRSAPLALCLLAATASLFAQPAKPEPAGKAPFLRTCARCHGADGQGGEMGPGIVARLMLRTDAELATLIHDGLPAKGMPGSALADAELKAVSYTHLTLPTKRIV